jgi:hypothetical protein
MMAGQERANRENLSGHRQKDAICACIRDNRSQMVGNSLRFVYGALSFVRRPLLEKFYIANSDSSLI